MKCVRVMVIEVVLLITACCLSSSFLTLADNHADSSSISSCELPLLNGSIFKVLNWYYNASGSSNITHSPDQVLLNANGWCANEQGFNIWGPRLRIMFGSEVKITRIEFGAVNNATLIEKVRIIGDNNDVNNGFCPYTGGGVLLNTSLSNDNSISMINISSHVIGTNITILPIQWKSHTPCLHLELYGCLNRPVCNSTQELFTMLSNTTESGGTQQLTLEFNSPVVVTSLMFPEGIYFRNVQFENGSGIVYSDFTGRNEFNLSTTFTFWSPELFVNNNLTITIGNQSFTGSNVTVYGCSQSDIIIRSLEPSPSSITPTATVITEKDYIIVEAGVPLASLTIGIIGILVLCGIGHAYRIKKSTDNKLKKTALHKDTRSIIELEESKETTLRKVDNELYRNSEDEMTIRNNIPYTAYLDGGDNHPIYSRNEIDLSTYKPKDESKTYESIHN